jgi:hypothetical protein
MLLPMDEKQFGFWKMRRSGTPYSTIANLPGISRQTVSRALLGMDEKIESALRGMAQANQIIPDKINAERGVLVGRSIPFKTAAISSSRRNTGSRSGMGTTATVVYARGMRNVLSCSGITRQSLASGLRNLLIQQRWRKNFL